MKKLFLIDAYAIIFRSYYALIRSPRINSKGLNTSAIMGFVNTLYEVMTKESPDYIGVAFDMGKTFRAMEPWQVYVLTSCEYFEKLYGRRADAIRKLYNGMIPCYLYQFFKNHTKPTV